MEINPIVAGRTQKVLLGGLLLAALAMGGCASAKVMPTIVNGPLPKPDMIIVKNFAVTMDEVHLDQGIMANALRNNSGASPTEEEVKVGHMVADKLAQTLVEELQKSGINAVRYSPGIRTSPTTAVIEGQFLYVNQGNQTQRVWVGFGLGGSRICTQVQVIQDGKLAAAADTDTQAGLKPGMLLSAGLAAGGGNAAPLIIGGVSAGASEAFTATVDADASRTAKELARTIKKGYIDRGWL